MISQLLELPRHRPKNHRHRERDAFEKAFHRYRSPSSSSSSSSFSSSSSSSSSSLEYSSSDSETSPEPEEAQAPNRCPYCATVLHPTATMCAACNSAIPSASAPPVLFSAPVPVISRVEPAAQSCTKCSKQNPGGAQFCFNCGSKFGIMLSASCFKCNERVAESDAFCHACGNILKHNPFIVHNEAPTLPELRITSEVLPLVEDPHEQDSRRDKSSQRRDHQPSAKQAATPKGRSATGSGKNDKESKLSEISPGSGNWRGQIDHIAGHMKLFAQSSPAFQDLIGPHFMGSILSAIVEAVSRLAN